MSLRSIWPALAATFALTVAGCSDDTSPEPADDGGATSEVVDEEPTDEPADEEPADDEEEPVNGLASEGVVELDEPISWSDAGLELEVDAVRIVSVEQMAEEAGQDIAELLEDPRTESLVGLRVTLRNTTDSEVEWFAAGLDTAIVLDGQQGTLFTLGDLGDTIRPEAEQIFNPYYESRVPVDDARAAGSFVWSVGDPVDPETFETVAEVGDLEIRYQF